ncbi:MAG: phosphatase PAP2 family protein [Cyclobacteriaceae bacterium]|nr:phosphatase PAP2 family protein [Cyclobacteriaceae bacterium]
MDFIAWLDQIDKDLFLKLNEIHSPFFDTLFFALSGKLIWVPFYLFLIYLIYKFYKKKTLIWVLCIGISVGIADFTASGILKPTVERLRPSRNPDLQEQVHIVNNYRGGIYGFASSHSANTFALATFFFLLLRRKMKYTSLLFLWAFVVSYSRIYLGVHYPGDILAGMLIGIGAAFLVYSTAKRFIQASP